MSDEEISIENAFQHHQAGRLEQANALYRKIISATPDHPVALHYLGLLMFQMGDDIQSVELMKKAVAAKPDYLQAHCNLANTLVDLKQGEDAEASCRAALKLDPEKINAHNALAKALLLQGRDLDAIVSCQRVLDANPHQDDTHATYAGALHNLGRFNEALEHYNQAIYFNPQYPEYYNSMGDTYRELSRYSKAARSFQKAINLDAKEPLYHNNLGSALFLQNSYEPAIASYQKAVDLEPRYIMAQQNLANALRTVGRADEAIVCLKNILKDNPDLASTRHNLAALQGETTDTAPKEYITELFDEFANQFEDHLQDKLHYQIPSLLKTIMENRDLCTQPYDMVVDLGCGTGLGGVKFRDIAKTLIGIDLSKKMIENAQAKNVYDKLDVNDLISGLENIDTKINLFMAMDVLIYVGNLRDTFAAVQKSAAPDAFFVFSTEHLNSGESDTPYILQDTSRYAHTQAYIDDLAQEFGFTIDHFETTDLRKDKDGWIPGGIYILKFGSN